MTDTPSFPLILDHIEDFRDLLGKLRPLAQDMHQFGEALEMIFIASRNGIPNVVDTVVKMWNPQTLSEVDARQYIESLIEKERELESTLHVSSVEEINCLLQSCTTPSFGTYLAAKYLPHCPEADFRLLIGHLDLQDLKSCSEVVRRAAGIRRHLETVDINDFGSRLPFYMYQLVALEAEDLDPNLNDEYQQYCLDRKLGRKA